MGGGLRGGRGGGGREERSRLSKFLLVLEMPAHTGMGRRQKQIFVARDAGTGLAAYSASHSVCLLPGCALTPSLYICLPCFAGFTVPPFSIPYLAPSLPATRSVWCMPQGGRPTTTRLRYRHALSPALIHPSPSTYLFNQLTAVSPSSFSPAPRSRWAWCAP